MENEMQYLPINIYGEHVVIDYHKRELIFPNRGKEENKLNLERKKHFCSDLILCRGLKAVGTPHAHGHPSCKQRASVTSEMFCDVIYISFPNGCVLFKMYFPELNFVVF